MFKRIKEIYLYHKGYKYSYSKDWKTIYTKKCNTKQEGVETAKYILDTFISDVGLFNERIKEKIVKRTLRTWREKIIPLKYFLTKEQRVQLVYLENDSIKRKYFSLLKEAERFKKRLEHNNNYSAQII